MSIRFEREQMFCTHINKEVTQLVTYSTPADLAADDDLAWEKSATECLRRKSCKDACPGEQTALQKK